MNNSVLRQMTRDRQSTTALSVPRSMRGHVNPILFKLSAGLAVPVAAAGLFREDAVAAGQLSMSIVMDETAEILINPVTVKVSAYLVPWLAFDRFSGRDEFEASYKKKPFKEGDDIIDFIESQARGIEGDWPVMDALGRHGKDTQQMSTMYIEAYNKIINYRNKNLSLEIADRDRLDATFAPCERELGRHRQIVPSFDERSMEGSINVNLLNNGSLPLHGLGTTGSQTVTPSSTTLLETGTNDVTYDNYSDAADAWIKTDALGRPMVDVQLEDANLTFSLASIHRAKKMQAFAQLRKRYNGLDDDELIENLMDGIRMPDKLLEQPIYLGAEKTAFGFNKRYSSSSGNLDESVVDGAALLNMQIATPRINTGGVLMFIAEIQPEQLFEREVDPFLAVTDVEEYPQFIRDDGDEQKVDIVKNKEIDTAHDDPEGHFGYRPLNGKYDIKFPCIGTGYFAPVPTTTFDENRSKIWDSTPLNPTLGENWLLVGDIPTDVFEYSTGNAFEINGSLSLAISGNTVFGPPLIEDDNDYEKVEERVPGPEDQISQTV